MDGCCHGDNLRILLINRHKPYFFVIETIWSAVDLCLLISRILRLSPWQHPSIHPSIPVLSPSHPYIPSFKSKDFSFTCLLSFFGCTRPITFLFYSLRNILPEAICCCLATSCFYAPLLELCTLTFIATIANMGQL